MNQKQKRGVLFVIIAAAIYALNAPVSKLLLHLFGGVGVRADRLHLLGLRE